MNPFHHLRPRAAEDEVGHIAGVEHCADCGHPFAGDELKQVGEEKFCEKCVPIYEP